uniref:Uncharacterized protein n=1 Tax=Rhodopseudomonas palustris (strain BisA53) TaxID=316055 RepID=Q07Q24_RHOP5
MIERLSARCPAGSTYLGSLQSGRRRALTGLNSISMRWRIILRQKQDGTRHLAPLPFAFDGLFASSTSPVCVLQTASVNIRRNSSLVLGKARTVDARGLDACQFVMALIWGVGADFKPFSAWAAEKIRDSAVLLTTRSCRKSSSNHAEDQEFRGCLIPQKPTIAWLFAGDGRTFD